MSGPGSTHDEIASHGRRGSAGADRPSGALRLRRMIPYGIILVIGCLLLYQTGKFDYDRQAASIGPDAWPKLVLSLMVLACAYEIVRLAVFWRGDEPVRAPEGEMDGDPSDVADNMPSGIPSNLLQASMGLGTIVAYLLSLPYLGFFLATFVFICVFALVAGYRRYAIIVSVGLGLTLLFMVMFMRVIYVSLPIGVEPFSRVSILLMKILGIS